MVCVVIQMFLVEERIKIKENPAMTMDDVNKDFAIWLIIITTKNPIDLFMANPPIRYTSKPNPACIVPLKPWLIGISGLTRQFAGK